MNDVASPLIGVCAMHDLSLAGHFKVLSVAIAASIAFVLVGDNVRFGSGSPSQPAEMPGYDRQVPHEERRPPAAILIAYQAHEAR
jgi:hypothetical protein